MVSKSSSGPFIQELVAHPKIDYGKDVIGIGMTYQVWFPQALTGTEQLIAGGSTDNEVLGEIDTADAVEATDEGLPRRVVDSSNDRTDEPRTKPSLV